MSVMFDHFDHYGADEDDSEDDEGGYGFGRTQTKTCTNCKKTGLIWEDDNGKWVLLERSGRIHKCKPKTIGIDLNALIK